MQTKPAHEANGSCCADDECGSTVNIETKQHTSCCSDKNDCNSAPSQGQAEERVASGFQASFRIHGMDCPACGITIEKSLKQLDHIQQVVVNYNTAKMQIVSTDPTALEQIPVALKKLGFTAETIDTDKNKRTYLIEGMDCSSCALTLENHLKSQPAVTSIKVNFSTGKMHIVHDNDVQTIMDEVAKVGFTATLATRQREQGGQAGQGGQRPQNKGKVDLSLTIFSGAMLALGFIGTLTDVSSNISTALFILAMITGGYKPAKSAFYAIKSRSLDMNVLMSIAAIGAGLIGEWLEGATVVWLFAIGNALQTRAIEKTRNSIRGLMDLTPSEAWLKSGETISRTPVEEIAVGQIIIIKPGEKIPLDGDIVVGVSSVNQAPITGESVPVDKEPGDVVYAGTINESGSLEVKVTKLVEDTTVAKIIHLVEEAQEKKAPTQAFIDRFAHIYTPIVFAVAMAMIVFPPLFGWGTWAEWYYKGLELLVVACPCALVISTPVAIVSAIGNAAKNGVLIKGGAFLEIAGAVNAIAFDKTGTLTEGKPKVSHIETWGESKESILSIARTIEEHSKHPIAQAILSYAAAQHIAPRKGESFQTIVGKGAQATIEGTDYFAGNLKLFQDMNVPLNNITNYARELQQEGNTLVLIGTRHHVLGLIAVADAIRPATLGTISKLKDAGIQQVVMLTGDNEGAARKISTQSGIDRYFADLLPENKVEAVKKMQQEGYKIAMVGDGINDAPALATADLGIAMGGAGTDTAMETADIVLMADNLEKLPHTVELSRKALRIIKQNIWFSIAVKLVALMLIFPGWLTLWLAVLSDTGAAILVILNSMRLLKMKSDS
ncbi:heavy metal translocating P-type ATPase [Paenibacillus sp. 481]|uniref:heavy metal translocating P-type ATPase n=1 Tax=Paenibacillus sp. 481 TaxID=2835869 RepID=UPI003FA78CFF